MTRMKITNNKQIVYYLMDESTLNLLARSPTIGRA